MINRVFCEHNIFDEEKSLKIQPEFSRLLFFLTTETNQSMRVISEIPDWFISAVKKCPVIKQIQALGNFKSFIEFFLQLFIAI